MRDTDVLLTIDLDIADAQATAKKLDKEVQDIFSSRNGKQSVALTSMEAQIKQSVHRVRELREALIKTAQTPAPTQQYAELSKRLEDYIDEYDKLIEKSNELEESDQLDSAAYLKVATRMEQVEAQMDALTRRKEQLEKRGQAFVDPKETEQYKKQEAELDKELDKLKQKIIHHQEIQKQENKELNTQGHINMRLKQVPRLLMRYALGVSSIYILWRKVRQAIGEGLQNLKDSGIGDYKDIINELNASTLNLKNTLASVLAPIITAIVPYIQSFVDSLSDVLDKLAQLIAAASGQKTYIRAIRQTGDAIERMGRQANRALSPLDNLNVITAAPNYFEEVEIPEETFAQLDDFLAMLDLLKVGLEAIAGLALASVILDFTDSLGVLSGSTALNNLGSSSGPLAKMAGFLGQVAAITAISIGLNLLIDWTLKETTGEGLEFWLNGFLSGSLDWQRDFDDWWEKNINEPVGSAVTELFVGTPKKVSDDPTIQALWTSCWKLLTPAGWKYTFIDQPIEAIKQLGEWFRTPKAPSWDDLPFVAKSPNKAQSAIQLIIDKVQELINKWKEFHGLTDDEFAEVKEELKTRAEDVYGYRNVLANNTTTNQAKFKQQTELRFIEKPLEAAGEIQKDISGKLDEIINDLEIPSIEEKLDEIAKTIKLPNVIGLPKIRGYAAGQVIPPSMSKHLAILGDNKQETEVVSPLSTIQEALVGALEQTGLHNSGQEIVINIDGREVMRAMVKQNGEYKKQHGVSAFA